MSRNDVRKNLASWEADSAEYQACNASQLNRWDGGGLGDVGHPRGRDPSARRHRGSPHTGARLWRGAVRHQPREARRGRDRSRLLGESARRGPKERRGHRGWVPAGACERRGASLRRCQLRPRGVRSRRDLVHRSARHDPGVREGASLRRRAGVQHRDAVGGGRLARRRLAARPHAAPPVLRARPSRVPRRPSQRRVVPGLRGVDPAVPWGRVRDRRPDRAPPGIRRHDDLHDVRDARVGARLPAEHIWKVRRV